MTVLLCYFLAFVSFTASEFRLLNDQRVPPWTTYYSSGSQDCSTEGLRQSFPNIYGINGATELTIGPPYNFSVTSFEREALELGGLKNVYYPGGLVSFFPPVYGAENVEGYEILLHRSRGLVCVIMDFTGRNWPSQNQIELELFPLSGLTHYQLTITSLPKYDENQQSNLTDLVTGVFGYYKTRDDVLPPSANWYASVRYYVINDENVNDTRSLEIVFSRPPPEYNFESFEIVLVPKEGNSEIRKAKTSNLFYVFEAVPQGDYKIMMWPVDPFFSQNGRCLCRQYNGACSNCVSTVVETVIIA